jgi:cytochrome c553
MKATIWIQSAVLLGLSVGTVVAAPSSQVAWTPETLNLVKGGNPDKGKQLAASCQACHGDDAANAATPNPYLNAQLPTYLYRQLRDYKDGSRQHPVMSSIAAALSDQDMADIAQWYSRQAPIEPKVEDNLDTPVLVESGDSKRLIPPCGICHGWGGRGEPVDTPRLAGQKSAYLTQTLASYRSGERHNDIYRRMRAMSERLSEDEIRALAAYYASLK